MNKKREHIKGEFWIKNRFIRIYAKDLSIYAQMIYMCLCCYARKENNGAYQTFIGYDRIANNLGIDKDSVSKHIKLLEAYGLVRLLKRKRGEASLKVIYTDSYNNSKPAHVISSKDNKDNKDVAGLENLKKNRPDLYKKFMDRKK